MSGHIIHNLLCSMFFSCFCMNVFAENGCFDVARWSDLQSKIRNRAISENIGEKTIDETLKLPMFVPAIIKNDKNQSEFKLTLDEYLNRTVNEKRITNGKLMRNKYPSLLSRVENIYGIPHNVILAFWGLESNYGEVKSKYKLTDAFFTLIYDGRREKFFTNQLLALMKIADKNHLDINSIRGSWAGAMGHFQFIPTTLEQYGVDGNGDNSIDIINSIGDAMYSAGNYLNKLGWNKNEKIARRVILPADFDTDLLNGDKKKTLSEWFDFGVLNPDGSPIPTGEMVAGLVADVANIDSGNIENASLDSDVQPKPVIVAYLTYPNFYRIKKWNNSNWYAIAIATLADKIK